MHGALQNQRGDGPPVSVTLVIIPRFPLHALALCVDALRVANREALRTAFIWTIATEDGEPVDSSSGLVVKPFGKALETPQRPWR